ncbi:MAG: xylulose kinase [bacterium]|nr:xylulose kinase [bacterium]
MKDSYLIGVDIGVSFVKVAIYDTEGNCKTTITKSSPAEYPKPGMFIQTGDDFLRIVLDALKESVEQSGIQPSVVEAIAFSGQMGGAIGVDKDWNALTTWSNPMDTRYTPYVTHMQARAQEQILRLSGTNFPFFAPKLLWWKNEYSDIYKKVSKFMILCGFIIGKMSDIPIEDAFVDRTYLQMTGIADIRHNQWSGDLCDEFGIAQEKLPTIVDSHRIVGKLSKQAARECGLQDGIPLVAGAGDKPAGSLGAGMVTPGLLVDESASFAALSLCVDRYVPDLTHKTLENIPSPIPGHYFPSFFIFGSGATHAWFKDVFGEEEKRIAVESGTSAYAILDEKAKHVPPGSEKLFALGLLGGRGYPSDPDIRGMWLGHTWSHKKEHFYRSLLESFAYEYAYVFNVMKKTYPDLSLDEVRVIGGGSRSDLWNQIKSDVVGLPYVKLNRDDFALLGDVLIAGHAVGIYADLQETAKKFAVKTRRYVPNEKNHTYYTQYVEFYEHIFDRVRDIYLDLKNFPSFQ